ncbi:MAG: enolase C-terminal domain-like protein [Verrucomicrobiales bacterium]
MPAPCAPIEVELKTFRLAESFRIAHGATAERQVVRIRRGGGIGEAPFVPYYREVPHETVAWLKAARTVNQLPPDGPKAGRLALSILLADLEAQKAAQPLWKMWGLSARRFPPASRSLGIPVDLPEFAKKIRAHAAQFPVIKLKLGSGNLDFDEAIVAAAREAAPHVRMFADANCGWMPAAAAKIIQRLPRWKIEFVEQPVGRDSIEPWQELRALLPAQSLPLFADESAQSAQDIPRLSGLVEGVNIKLVKCGGLDRAREMISAARAHGLRVLLGCMIESSVGITAAAHLAPLADLLDLDGHLYLADDDFVGATYDGEGRLILPTAPGLGCREKSGVV